MFQKTDEVKVLRDPVHSHVRVEYEVIWQLINSAWIQRLRRIRQTAVRSWSITRRNTAVFPIPSASMRSSAEW